MRYSTTTAMVTRLAVMSVLAASLSAASADSQYVYDAAGRLIQTTGVDGVTYTYQYDTNDNLIAITRFPLAAASAPALASLSAVNGSPPAISPSGPGRLAAAGLP